MESKSFIRHRSRQTRSLAEITIDSRFLADFELDARMQATMRLNARVRVARVVGASFTKTNPLAA